MFASGGKWPSGELPVRTLQFAGRPMDVTQQQETSPRRNVGNERGGGGSEDEGGEGLEQSASVTVVVPRRESQADKWVSGYQPETS